MNIVFVQEAFALNVAKLITYADSCGWGFTFGDTWAHDGHEPDSLHYERLAVDFNLFVAGAWVTVDNPIYESLGAYWKQLDQLCRWGGDIVGKRDVNHFSMVPSADDPRI